MKQHVATLHGGIDKQQKHAQIDVFMALSHYYTSYKSIAVRTVSGLSVASTVLKPKAELDPGAKNRLPPALDSSRLFKMGGWFGFAAVCQYQGQSH